MNVPTTIDAAAWLGKYLEGADGDTDLARAMLGAFAEALMSAQASMQCGAGYGERSRRAGELAQRLPAPALGHQGRDHRTGHPQAPPGGLLARVLAPAPAAGRTGPGGGRLPGLRRRGLDPAGRRPGQGHGHRRDLQVRGVAPGQRARQGGERVQGAPPRWRSLSLFVDRRPHPTGARRAAGWSTSRPSSPPPSTREGHREIIGFDIATTEDTAAWTAFLRALVARGLSGVELVISDAHGGIKAAIALVFAEASWQRCRTHFMANLASRCAKGNWPMIATLVRSIFEQPDRDTTWASWPTSPTSSPRPASSTWSPTCSTPPTTSWPSAPSRSSTGDRSAPTTPRSGSTRRSAGAPTWSGSSPTGPPSSASSAPLLAEQTDEWAITRRYMSAESLKTQKKSRTLRLRPAACHRHGRRGAATDAVT